MSGRQIEWAALTDVGRARERNEDAYFGGDNVFAVADGLGGHNAGDVASRLAVEPIAAFDRSFGGVSPDRIADALSKAVLDANRAVYQRAQADAKVRGMGTTLTVLAIADSSAHLAHVGDSRCYLIRDGEISQLSSDHTLVARMVAEGKLTPEQAETHPQRSILTRALGAEPEIDVDTLEIQIQPGDRLVLCSDGLSSTVGDEQIRLTLADSTDLREGCRRLVEAANSLGGPDNITVVLLEVTGTPPAQRAPMPVVSPATVAEPAPDLARRRRRIPVRPIVWTLVVLALGLGSWLGFRWWIDRSYYVGLSEGTVTIFRGLPTEVAGVELHRVEEKTDIQIGSLPELWRQRLRDGITADTLAEARQIVSRIPLRPGAPGATPTPTPSRT